jgi:hypothetical protein
VNVSLFAMAGSTIEVAPIDPASARSKTLIDFEQIDKWTVVSSAHCLGRAEAVVDKTESGDLHTIVLLTRSTAEDLGKQALVSASRDQQTCAVRLSFKDAPTGGVPSRRYFAAHVSSIDDPEQTHGHELMARFHLEVCSQIARAAASIISDIGPIDTIEHTTAAAPLAA